MEEFEAFLAGGRRVEGYEPLASLIEGDLEKVLPLELLLLRLLGRGGVPVELAGSSESPGSKNELRFCKAGPDEVDEAEAVAAAALWVGGTSRLCCPSAAADGKIKVGDVGDDGREEAEGGRSRAERSLHGLQSPL